ncbi:MAG: sulfite exporter TauE/SafE family protein [Deltaproteobacteria bacterium]|nr:sulfite exporter TauE/SafE family protein [Deltaproteobacteria bacterium]
MAIVLGISLVIPLWAPAVAGPLEDAIAKAPQGTGKGQIDPKAEPGYLGIPGGLKVNIILAFCWAIWVGWIFSTVGAFGGIMAGVGHISVFGLSNYGRSFKDTSPTLDKLITDSIRVSNQYLVGLSGLISSINYWRMGRLVLPLAVALGLGSIVGSSLVANLTAGKVSGSTYMGYFGLIVFVLAIFLIYQITPRGQASKKAAKEAVQKFEKAVKEKKDTADAGVKITKWSAGGIFFTFYGVEFKFNPWLAIFGGLIISGISAFIGVGGGFLLVPYMTAVVGIPMFIAAGTSALAVLVSMITSIFSYMVVQGAVVHWSLIGVELIGIFIGSTIGPYTSKYIPDKYLQIIFIAAAVYVGLGYTTKGFLGQAIVPM